MINQLLTRLKKPTPFFFRMLGHALIVSAGFASHFLLQFEWHIGVEIAFAMGAIGNFIFDFATYKDNDNKSSQDSPTSLTNTK